MGKSSFLRLRGNREERAHPCFILPDFRKCQAMRSGLAICTQYSCIMMGPSAVEWPSAPGTHIAYLTTSIELLVRWQCCNCSVCEGVTCKRYHWKFAGNSPSTNTNGLHSPNSDRNTPRGERVLYSTSFTSASSCALQGSDKSHGQSHHVISLSTSSSSVPSVLSFIIFIIFMLSKMLRYTSNVNTDFWRVDNGANQLTDTTELPCTIVVVVVRNRKR